LIAIMPVSEPEKNALQIQREQDDEQGA